MKTHASNSIDPLGSLSLRRQLTLIFAIVIGTGILLGRLLLQLGMDSIIARSTIVFPVSYLVFFLVVHFWRVRIHEQNPASPEARRRIRALRKTKKKPTGDSSDHGPSWWSILDGLNFASGEVVLILGLVFLVIFVVVWVLGEAPVILAEACFDLGLSATLARALRRRSSHSWQIGLFKKTAGAFILFYVSSLFLLWFAHKTCPEQPTLTKIVRECWFGDR